MFCINSIFCIIYELKKSPVLKWHSISILYNNSCLIYKVMLKYRSHFVLVVIFQVTIAPWGTITLLKSISYFHSYLSLIIPARFEKESPNFHKKAKPWKILVAVVKGRGTRQGGHNLPPSVPLCPFVSRLPPFSERDEKLTGILHDWHSRHTCTCVMPSHSWPMM